MNHILERSRLLVNDKRSYSKKSIYFDSTWSRPVVIGGADSLCYYKTSKIHRVSFLLAKPFSDPLVDRVAMGCRNEDLVERSARYQKRKMFQVKLVEEFPIYTDLPIKIVMLVSCSREKNGAMKNSYLTNISRRVLKLFET